MKTTKLSILIFFITASFGAFAQKADSISMKLTGRIVGTWQIQSTSRAGRDNSKNSQQQSIKFKRDAKYVWFSEKVKLDSGTYNTNESSSEVYLQSYRDKDHLAEWKINLKTNTSMTMTAKKGSKADGTTYELMKVASGK